MRRLTITSTVAAAMSIAAAPTAGQDIHITPSIGAFHSAHNLNDVRRAARDDRLWDDVPIAFGLALEASILRLSAVYATGAAIDADGAGLSGTGRIGDGSLFAAAADLVFRPIPRLLFVQPYLLGGVAYKRERFSFDDDALADLLPENRDGHAWHFGIGADLMIGNFGVVAEVTDFVDRDDDAFSGGHDSFAMIGLRFRLR